jgi:hypothetical protein
MRRAKFCIAVFGSVRRPWTATEEAFLGKVPDGEIVKRLKRTLAAIRFHRQLLGLALFPP